MIQQNLFVHCLNLRKINIPTSITSFNNQWFRNCPKLKYLSIPESIENIDHFAFKFNTELEDLYISNSWKFEGDKLFKDIDGCLYSIQLPVLIKSINNKEIVNDLSETFTIPSNVTKLSDYCFANSFKLKEINGIENIKEIGKGCFFNCHLLNSSETIKTIMNQILEKYLTNEERKHIEEWSTLQCGKIIFESNIDDWGTITSTFKNRIINKEHLLFLIEDTNGNKFGIFIGNNISKYSSQSITFNSNSFHFNLNSLSQPMQPIKYPIHKSIQNGIQIFNENDEKLIQLGNILLFKENVCEGKCQYLSLNTSSTNQYKLFTPKQFIVIQMELSEEQKQQKIENERKRIEINKQLIQQLHNVYKINLTYLEQWTNMKIQEILFNSDIDNWDCNTSTFGTAIENRNNFVVLIQDTNDEFFGFFWNINSSKYSWNRNIDDSFFFNIHTRRTIKPTKFEMGHSGKVDDFKYGTSESQLLFSFGYMKVYKKSYV